jgi:8-oxo-dGTP pyrophosphatase MutT (NUDIX family)
MHRTVLLDKLRDYQPYDQHERDMYQTLVRFVETESGCFDRGLQTGHVTGSAWIIDHGHTRALLTHHSKLDRWLQLGGHADGDPGILRVALREAREESGLEGIRPLSEAIFDVDVHPIPARGDEPRHLHYDVRFLLEADADAPLIISSESKDLAWVSLAEINQFSVERSIARMAAKSLEQWA